MRLPLLVLHITGGIIGLLSGTIAMVFRKGSRGHRMAGDVFVIAMLLMAACAVPLAIMKHQLNNIFGGFLTFYLVTTAWATGRRRGMGTGILDWGALVFALALGVSLLTLGAMVANGRATGQAGVPLFMYFFLGSIPLLAAAGDIRMLVRGGITGKQRLARHLWRMCFGLFVATGSFFLGQQQVFPVFLRGSILLFFLAILPLVLLIFWLTRVRLAKRGIGAYLTREQDVSA